MAKGRGADSRRQSAVGRQSSVVGRGNGYPQVIIGGSIRREGREAKKSLRRPFDARREGWCLMDLFTMSKNNACPAETEAVEHYRNSEGKVKDFCGYRGAAYRRQGRLPGAVLRFNLALEREA